MVTGWEMVPETAKALSAPITKLIEVVAAGGGRLYGPTDIRRTAKAEGDALVLREEAKARASEVAQQATQRLLDKEERRQKNIEKIARIAQAQLPNEVSTEPVELDWITKFFNEAQDVSNEQMQYLWGKLLAGEVANPGSISRRTLSIVANLGQKEAALFEIVCSLTAKIEGANPSPLLMRVDDECAKSRGLGLDGLQDLQATGLIAIESLGTIFTYKSSPPGTGVAVTIERPGNVVFVAKHSADTAVFKTGLVSLTSPGCELFSIADWRAVPEHDVHIQESIRSNGWTIEPKS